MPGASEAGGEPEARSRHYPGRDGGTQAWHEDLRGSGSPLREAMAPGVTRTPGPVGHGATPGPASSGYSGSPVGPVSWRLSQLIIIGMTVTNLDLAT